MRAETDAHSLKDLAGRALRLCFNYNNAAAARIDVVEAKLLTKAELEIELKTSALGQFKDSVQRAVATVDPRYRASVPVILAYQETRMFMIETQSFGGPGNDELALERMRQTGAQLRTMNPAAALKLLIAEMS